MARGVIKTILHDRGFGFIKTSGNGDRFFHFKDILFDEAELAVGLDVTFDITTVRGREAAIDVDIE